MVIYQANKLTRNSSGKTRPQSSPLTEPLWTDSGLLSGIGMRNLISTLKKKKTGVDWKIEPSRTSSQVGKSHHQHHNLSASATFTAVHEERLTDLQGKPVSCGHLFEKSVNLCLFLSIPFPNSLVGYHGGSIKSPSAKNPELSKVGPFKPRVGQNTTLLTSPAGSNYPF